MKKNLTELIFVIDQSGSMSALTGDTIGGFNSLLARQREGEGEVIVTTVLFNREVTVLHDRIPIAGVAPLTGADYCPGGATALYDAIGTAIGKAVLAQSHTMDCERPGKTMMVITTDGMENASTHYTRQYIRQLIDMRRELGWEFIFLGANIDSAKEAGSIGISSDRSVNYLADAPGMAVSYSCVNSAVDALRTDEPMCDCGWRDEADADFCARSPIAYDMPEPESNADSGIITDVPLPPLHEEPQAGIWRRLVRPKPVNGGNRR